MTEFIYYAAISLDGFIATTDGGVDWLDGYPPKDEDYGYDSFSDSVQAIVMGRGTYEKALSFGKWHFGDKPCWVFTSQDLRSDIPSVNFTNKTPAAFAETLKKDSVNRAWMMGGAKLGASFFESGLIHEFDLAVIPTILGDGIPMINPTDCSTELNLVDSKVHKSGVVQLKYRTSTA